MYDIIEGRFTKLPSSVWLTNASAAAEGLDETGLPSEGYVPTASGEHAPVPPSGQGYTLGTGAPVQPAPGAGNKTVFDAQHP